MTLMASFNLKSSDILASGNAAWRERLLRDEGRKDSPVSPATPARRPVSRGSQWENEQHKAGGLFMPIYVRNPLNNRRHFRAVARDAKAVRGRTKLLLMLKHVPKTLPVTVTMIRYGSKAMDEGCGLNASLKPVRDGVADYFREDDADPRFTWIYRQEKCPRGNHGVRVLVGGYHA